jgi:hypothetical protein
MRKKFIKVSLIASLLLASANANAFWLFGDDSVKSEPVTIGNKSSHKPVDISQEVSVLNNKAPNLNPKVLKLALTAYNNAATMGYGVRKDILTVIDYSLPDNDKRLWIFDLRRNKVLYNTFVAHGQGSGGLYADHFSNTTGSHASSIGLFLTQNTYYGSKGYALRLNGLDKGFNDRASARDVVIHGAWYVNPQFAAQYGHIGRSWGCPSVTPAMARPIINTIKEGSVVFAYAPKYSWLHESRFLRA